MIIQSVNLLILFKMKKQFLWRKQLFLKKEIRIPS
jgi:hypothetical protein